MPTSPDSGPARRRRDADGPSRDRRDRARADKTPDGDGAADNPAGKSAGLRPVSVVVISVILVLEGLALLGVGLWLIVELMVATPTSYAGAIFLAAFPLLLAVGLLTVGHFLFRGYRWARSPGLVWQLFMLVLSFSAMSSGLVLIGVAMLAAAVVVLVLLFRRDVMDFTSRAGSDRTVL